MHLGTLHYLVKKTGRENREVSEFVMLGNGDGMKF
jgi:hypothetical protein